MVLLLLKIIGGEFNGNGGGVHVTGIVTATSFSGLVKILPIR